MKYCEKCGEHLEDDAIFCGKCGHKVGKKSNEAFNTNDIESKNISKTISTNSGLDKSPKKKSPLIPILCGIIGVLVVVVIIMAVVMAKKSSDKNRENRQMESAQKESTEQTSLNNETTTEKLIEVTTKSITQASKSIDDKLTGEWIAQEEQNLGQNNTCTITLDMKVNSINGSDANIDLRFKRVLNSGKIYTYLIKGLEANIVSGRRLEFDVSKSNLVLTNNPDSESSTLHPFQGKVQGTGTIEIDTLKDDEILVTIVNVYFGNSDFSFSATEMNKQ